MLPVMSTKLAMATHLHVKHADTQHAHALQACKCLAYTQHAIDTYMFACVTDHGMLLQYHAGDAALEQLLRQVQVKLPDKARDITQHLAAAQKQYDEADANHQMQVRLARHAPVFVCYRMCRVICTCSPACAKATTSCCCKLLHCTAPGCTSCQLGHLCTCSPFGADRCRSRQC